MTIEEVVLEATDHEGFSHEGEVIVQMPDDIATYATQSVIYDVDKKQLIILIA